MSARYADLYIDAVNQATQQWWIGKEHVKHEASVVLGVAMASLQQVGSCLSTILAVPLSTLAARNGTADISSRVESALAQLASQRVGFSGLTEIRSYLVHHSDLLELLPSLCQTISELFDSDTKQSLEYYRDPQYPSDEYLCLYLRSGTFDLSIIDKCDTVTDGYSDAFANINGWVLITPDLRTA